MKKIYYILFLLGLFMIIPSDYVYASCAEVLLECPDKIAPDKSITCTVSGIANNVSISSLEGKIVTSGNVEVVGFSTDSIWKGDGDNGSIDLYTDSNKSSKFAIGTITLEVRDESDGNGGVITLDNFIFYDDSFQPLEIASVSKNIAISSNDSFLSSLSISCGKLSPGFDKNIFSYTATCDSDNVNILANVNDSKSKLVGVGVKNLNYGNNYFYVTVTSESGKKQDYKIVITRPDYRNNNSSNNKEEDRVSSDSSLKSLLVSGYNIDFDSKIYEYTLAVKPDVEKLDISYITGSKKASVNIIGNDNLKFGNNKLEIIVTAEDKSVSTYILNVTRNNKECIVNDIDILGYDFNFNCNTYDYELKINDESSLNIVVFLNNNNAKTNIYNNYNLKNNEVIKVSVDLSGEKHEYNIKILKDEKNNFLLIGGIILGIVILVVFVIIFMIVRKKRNNKNIVVTDELVWVPNDNKY